MNLCITLQQRWETCRHVDARDVRHPRADEAAWQWQLAWRPLELHGLLKAKSAAALSTTPCTVIPHWANGKLCTRHVWFVQLAVCQ